MERAELGLGDWSWQPTIVGGIAALVVLYAIVHRRGALPVSDDVTAWLPSPGWRPVCFALGIATGWVALLSPIDKGGDEYLLAIHMVQHLLLMMVAPPLVLLGIAGIHTTLPERRRRLWSGWLRLTHPATATLLFNVVLLVWHYPPWYDATLRNEPLHVGEHLTFIAVGILFWWHIVDPVRRDGQPSAGPATKIAMLVVAGVLPTLLGFLFVLAGRAFYPFYVEAPRLWGMSPVADQQLAGLIMFGLGNVIYFVAISVIFLRLPGSPGDDEREQDAEEQRALEGGRGEMAARSSG